MEPMNVALSHAKVRVTTHLSSPVFVAGEEITGKMELDCRTDKGLGISTMMVELVAVQGRYMPRQSGVIAHYRVANIGTRAHLTGSFCDFDIYGRKTSIPRSGSSTV
jgi:hypothetical protein